MRIRCTALLLLGLLVVAGCVSRNVERVSSEEAAGLGTPPEPLSPDERAAGVINEPGISGTIRLADAAQTVPAGTLYIIVRVAGRDGGPPLAVKRLPGEIPVDFKVTAADSMIPGTPLVDSMDLIVRLDQDGDAWSQQPGDLEGQVSSVGVGDTVEVLLSVAADTASE